MDGINLRNLAHSIRAVPDASGPYRWFAATCSSSRGAALPLPKDCPYTVVGFQAKTVAPGRKGVAFGVKLRCPQDGMREAMTVYVAGVGHATPAYDVRESLARALDNLALPGNAQMYLYTQECVRLA